MNKRTRIALRLASGLAGTLLACAALAQVTFYENDDYGGRRFSSNQSVANFMDHGYNDRASSIVVTSQTWEVCENTQYSGQCVLLRPGNYPSLRAMGLNDRVSSVRLVVADTRNNDPRAAPVPAPLGWQGPNAGRSFRTNVTSVRGIFGARDQRCWVSPAEAEQARGDLNLPGRRNDGNDPRNDPRNDGRADEQNRFREGSPVAVRNLPHCTSVPQVRGSDYWEVSYSFRGRQHHVQMHDLPDSTIVVDRRGEPRV